MLFAEVAGNSVQQVIAHDIPEHIFCEIFLFFSLCCGFPFSLFLSVVIDAIDHFLIGVQLDRSHFRHHGGICAILDGIFQNFWQIIYGGVFTGNLIAHETEVGAHVTLDWSQRLVAFLAHRHGDVETGHVVFSLEVAHLNLSVLDADDRPGLYQLGVFDAWVGVNLSHTIEQWRDGVLVVSSVGTMERGEDVLLKKVFSIHIRRHVVERSAHRTFAVWNGTEIEQSVDDRCSLLIHFDAVVEFADELSACTVGDGVHGRNESQGGVSLVGTHLEFGVGIARMASSSRGIYLLGITEDTLHHGVCDGVLSLHSSGFCCQRKADSQKDDSRYDANQLYLHIYL